VVAVEDTVAVAVIAIVVIAVLAKRIAACRVKYF
jgi:hypothetical protein